MARQQLLPRLGAGAVTLLLAAVVTLAGPACPADAATPALGVRGGQQVAPPGTAQQPTVASGGGNTLVVWSEEVDGTFGIYGRITSADTSTIAGRFTVTQVAGHDSVAPDVSWTGSQWLVVWEYTFSSTDHDVYAAFVTTAGVAGARFGISTPGTEQREPAVASSPGGGSLVLWSDNRAQSTTGWDIWGSSVTPPSAVSGASRYSVDAAGAPFDDRDPDITWATFPTSGWFCAWESLSPSETRIETYQSCHPGSSTSTAGCSRSIPPTRRPSSSRPRRARSRSRPWRISPPTSWWRGRTPGTTAPVTSTRPGSPSTAR